MTPTAAPFRLPVLGLAVLYATASRGGAQSPSSSGSCGEACRGTGPTCNYMDRCMWCTTKWVTYKNDHNEWRANCSGTMHTSELVCEITAGCASAPPPPSPTPPSPTPPPAQPAVGPSPYPPPVEKSHCGDSWIDCTMVVLSVVLAAVAAACCWARCRRKPRRQAPGKDDLEKCLCDYPVGGEAAVPVVMAETVQEHPRERLYASTAAQPHPSALCASTGLLSFACHCHQTTCIHPGAYRG